MNSEEQRNIRIKKNSAKVFVCLALLCLASFCCAVRFGAVGLSGELTGETARLIIRLRLVRSAAAGLAGIGLASAGLVLQTVTGNGLCAPNILGINAGAGFGAVLAGCFALGGTLAVSAISFAGALAASALVLIIARLCGSDLGKSTLVLAGVAVGALFNAGISFILFRHPDAAAGYSAFSSGGFSSVNRSILGISAVIIALCFVALMLFGGRLQLLLLGDDLAASLGVNVRLLRIFAIGAASAMSAAVVSYAGLIGFVGLAVPHISRSLLGAGVRKNLAGSAMLGFSLCILADFAGRVIIAPSELPAGIITAVIGAPFFIYLLLKRRVR